MKALSIWQPWASLIADGFKHFETRSWQTKYRGPLLICSSVKELPRYKRLELAADLQGLIPARYFHDYIYDSSGCLDGGYAILPFGKALCAVDLVEIYDCDEEESTDYLSSKEVALGDFSPGRFAWKLENVRLLGRPFPVRGRQGLFDVDDALVIEALKAA